MGMEAFEGFMVVDKPAGITSHDVVAMVRAVTGVKKVGHTGTLDPFATGVLPLALGGATRLIRFLDESLKVYDATIRLGAATDTGDDTGSVIRTAPVPPHDPARVEAVLATFLGDSMQTPPAYSAVKKDGKPLYKYAREGQTVEVDARPIKIHSLEVLNYEGDELRVLIHCSRGTYARVLADEIATALGSAGHLVALCRRQSGSFELSRSIDIQGLSDAVSVTPGAAWEQVLQSRKRDGLPWRPRDDVRASLRPHLVLPMQALHHLRISDVDDRTASAVRQGAVPPMIMGLHHGERFLVASGDRLIAIAEATPQGAQTVCVVTPA